MTRTQRTMSLLLAAGMLTIAACGQSGPLYLPGNPSRVQVEDPAAATEEASDGTADDEDATPSD